MQEGVFHFIAISFGEIGKPNDILDGVPASFWGFSVVCFDDFYFFADKLFNGIVFGSLDAIHFIVPDCVAVVDEDSPGMQLF